MKFLFVSFSFIIVCCVNFLSFAKSIKNSHAVGRHECPYPVLKQNGTEMAIDVVGFLSGIAEIKFNGAFGKLEAKRYCKIKCINGEWVGPLCLAEGGSEATGDGRFHPVFRSCSSQIFHSKFILSYQNKTVSSARDFSHNSVVQVRCKRFGIFKLIGDAHLKCHNGVWKHRIPTCIPTSSLTNFTDESAPPSVLAKITSGSASIEPTGELAVYPGSTVHLECLYLRSFGEPEWSWTSTYRTYTTGWSIDASERDWKFRLSIYYIKPQDTGIYTCSTPKGLTHSIILNVIEIHCDVNKVLTNDPNLLIQIQGSRLGQSTTYQCREGFKLNGTSSVTCQASVTPTYCHVAYRAPSCLVADNNTLVPCANHTLKCGFYQQKKTCCIGKLNLCGLNTVRNCGFKSVWSGFPPQCVPIVCPILEVQNNSVKLVKQDFGYGGTAIFQCPPGQKLLGATTLVCLINGEWSGKIPDCKEILCSPPLIPQNGKLEFGSESAKFPFRVGSELVFSCVGKHKIIGKEVIRCRESGVWSNPPPFCMAYCSHPGDPLEGRFLPRKVNYDVGDRISLACSTGYEPNFKIKPKCLKNGSWSEIGLECNLKRAHKFPGGKQPENVIIISKSSITSPMENGLETTPITRIFDSKKKTTFLTNEFVTLETTILNVTENEASKNETDFFYVIEDRSGSFAQ